MVIRSQKHAVFFSGDTGLTTEYESIRKKFGPFDLTMLEVGAYYPAWGDIHLGPDNAMKAHAMLGGVLLPIHWGTFSLAMHAWDQPVERLLELAPKTDAQLVMPKLGQAVEPAHVDSPTPWWREVELISPQADSCLVPRVPRPDSSPPKSVPWPMD
jgi:L-ascorbate metabolism protein UlaG (beta-lactamase superfamily)